MATKTKTMNTTEASEALGVDRKTFRRIAARNGIAPYDIDGAATLYKQSDINRLARKPNCGKVAPGRKPASTSTTTVTTNVGAPSAPGYAF